MSVRRYPQVRRPTGQAALVPLGDGVDEPVDEDDVDDDDVDDVEESDFVVVELSDVVVDVSDLPRESVW